MKIKTEPRRPSHFLLVVVTGLCLGHGVLGAATDPEPPASFATETAQTDWLGTIARLKQAAEDAPRDPSIRWELGNVYLRLNAPSEAESHLRAALEYGTAASAVLPTIARALVMQGKYKEVTALTEPRELSSDARALVISEKALAHLLLGERERAFEMIALAVRTKDLDVPRMRVIRARLLIAQGENEAAYDLIRDGALGAPDDADLLAFLGDLERDAGRAEAADNAYTKAIALSPNPYHLHILRARLRLDLGVATSAREDVELVEAIEPESYAAYFLRGRLDLLVSRPLEALNALQSAMLRDRGSFEAIFYAGLAAQAARNPSEAENLLRRAVTDKPDFLPGRFALTMLTLDQGRYAEAETLIRPVVEALPDQEQALRVLGAVLIAQNKSAEAVAVLERAATAAKAAPETQFQLAVALMASGEEDRGEAVFERLAAAQPSYRVVYEFILSHYLAVPDLPAARRWSERFVRELPKAADPYVWQAQVQMAEGRNDEASATLRRALVLDPKGTSARYALARIALAERREADARAQLVAVVAGKVDHKSALLSLAALERAANQPNKAHPWLRQAIQDFPTDPEPVVEMARFHLARKAPRDAITVLRSRNDQVFIENPSYLRVLAQAERLTGELQKSALTLRELMRISPDSVADRYAFASALLAVNDREGAEAALKQVLEQDPKQQEARLDYVRLLYADGRHEAAEEALAPIAGLNSPEVKLLRGLLAEHGKAPNEALRLVAEVHRDQPSTQTLLVLARLRARAGQVDQAITLQRNWIEGHPEDDAVRLSLAHDLAERGQIDAAIILYRQILSRRPDHVLALNNLAWHLHESDPQGAVDFATRAVELAPRSEAVVDTLAAIYAALGRADDALRTVASGLIQRANSEVLQLRKARLLLSAGQETEAVQLLVALAGSTSGSEEQLAAVSLLDLVVDSSAGAVSKATEAPPRVAPE